MTTINSAAPASRMLDGYPMGYRLSQAAIMMRYLTGAFLRGELNGAFLLRYTWTVVRFVVRRPLLAPAHATS